MKQKFIFLFYILIFISCDDKDDILLYNKEALIKDNVQYINEDKHLDFMGVNVDLENGVWCLGINEAYAYPGLNFLPGNDIRFYSEIDGTLNFEYCNDGVSQGKNARFDILINDILVFSSNQFTGEGRMLFDKVKDIQVNKGHYIVFESIHYQESGIGPYGQQNFQWCYPTYLKNIKIIGNNINFDF